MIRKGDFVRLRQPKCPRSHGHRNWLVVVAVRGLEVAVTDGERVTVYPKSHVKPRGTGKGNHAV